MDDNTDEPAPFPSLSWRRNLTASNNSRSNATGNSSRGASLSRVNAVLVIAVSAMALQLWGLRGGGGHSNKFGGDLDCRNALAVLLDAPQATATGAGANVSSADPPVPVPLPLPPPMLMSTDFPLPRADTNHSLIVAVLSRRNAFQVRNKIRETWAQGFDNVYFVLGQGCKVPPAYRGVDEGGNPFCKVKPFPLDHNYLNATISHIQKEQLIATKIQDEQERNHDILLMPHTTDMYRTLPAKLKFVYTFVHQHMPQISWVLKVDDDFFVRIQKFETLLMEEYTARNQPIKPIMIGGDIREEHHAHTGGKWKELPQFPHGALYPPFPLGSYGHVVNRPIVEYVAKYQDALFEYQGEDTSIGIWLSHPAAPNTTFISDPVRMSNGGDCRLPTKYVIGHDINTVKMQICHKVGGY